MAIATPSGKKSGTKKKSSAKAKAGSKSKGAKKKTKKITAKEWSERGKSIAATHKKKTNKEVDKLSGPTVKELAAELGLTERQLRGGMKRKFGTPLLENVKESGVVRQNGKYVFLKAGVKNAREVAEALLSNPKPPAGKAAKSKANTKPKTAKGKKPKVPKKGVKANS